MARLFEEASKQDGDFENAWRALHRLALDQRPAVLKAHAQALASRPPEQTSLYLRQSRLIWIALIARNGPLPLAAETTAGPDLIAILDALGPAVAASASPGNRRHDMKRAFADFPVCLVSCGLSRDARFLCQVMDRQPLVAAAVLHPDVAGPWDEDLATLALTLEDHAIQSPRGAEWHDAVGVAIDAHTQLSQLRYRQGDKRAAFPAGSPDTPWSALSPPQRKFSRLR